MSSLFNRRRVYDTYMTVLLQAKDKDNENRVLLASIES